MDSITVALRNSDRRFCEKYRRTCIDTHAAMCLNWIRSVIRRVGAWSPDARGPCRDHQGSESSLSRETTLKGVLNMENRRRWVIQPSARSATKPFEALVTNAGSTAKTSMSLTPNYCGALLPRHCSRKNRRVPGESKCQGANQ